MTPTHEHIRAVAEFSCLGDQCPDTCCKGWGMQLTHETIDLYRTRAPELMEAVSSGESEFVMRRDSVTDTCVKFDKGWCSIHRDYGADFLGDACHFYPRVTRSIGERVVTTAALSCPRTAQLMLLHEGAFVSSPRTEIRVPYSIKDYAQDTIDSEASLALHQLFIEQAGNLEFSAERNVMRVATVARSLEMQPQDKWPAAAGFYFRMAHERLPQAQAEASDPLHVVQALVGLISAAKLAPRASLMQTVDAMQAALGVRVDWETRGLEIAEDTAQRWLTMQHAWRTHQQAMQPVLRRYLQAQLSVALFPFAGLGTTLAERVTIIGVRFATVKLALMSEIAQRKEMLDSDTMVRIVYSLSRFLDHLADPALSLAIYHETGWDRESRLRALVGDA